MVRRRPSRAFVLVLIALAASLAYPLSFGPVYWICSDDRGRIEMERWFVEPLLELYVPLVWLLQDGPAPARDALRWYLGLWGAP